MIFSKRKPVLGIIIHHDVLECMIFDLMHTEFMIETTTTIPLEKHEIIQGFLFNPTRIIQQLNRFLQTLPHKPLYVMFSCTQPLIEECISTHLDQNFFNNTKIRWAHRPLAEKKIYSFGMQCLQLLQFQIICSLLRMHCLAIAPHNQCMLEVLSKRNRVINPPLENIKHLEEIIDIELFEHDMVSSTEEGKKTEQKSHYHMLGLYLLGRKYYERSKQPHPQHQSGSL